jgi:thiol-disulfide isomerase/thioredoxin
MPEFDGATAWLNSEPLILANLRGMVFLVDFWTYTCINWIRTLPYLRAWAERYGSHGLRIVGVHTPEFEVEHDIENVRRAALELRVEYPIVIDNDYAVWDAFANRYWPALYIADAKGHIRHHYFGEGGYEDSENVLRQLLADAGVVDLPNRITQVRAHGIEEPADWHNVRSSETYLGFERSRAFASPGGAFLDEAREYSIPRRLRTNEWALDGAWTIRLEEAIVNEPNGRIAIRFHARDLNLILVPPHINASAPIAVRLDGRPPGDAAGLDIDDNGNGTVRAARLYQLIRQRGPITDRLFEVELHDPGTSALCFTFG